MDYPRFALLLYAILGPSPRDSLLVKEGLQLKVGEGLEHMGRDERGRGILRVCYLHVGIMDRGRDKCCHGVMRAVEGEIGLQSELNAKLVASAPWLGPRVGLLQTFTSKLYFCQGVRWRQLQPKVPTIYCPLCGSGDVITRLQECIQSGIILGVLHVFVTGFFGRLASRHWEDWLLGPLEVKVVGGELEEVLPGSQGCRGHAQQPPHLHPGSSFHLPSWRPMHKLPCHWTGGPLWSH